MNFSQRALLYNRAEFSLGDKVLFVIIDDGRLRLGFEVPYHEIGTRRSIKSFPEKAVLHCAMALLMAVAVSYAAVGGEISFSTSMPFLVFGGAGLMLCLLSGYMRFDATRISVVSGNTILIFHDAQHQVILHEIYKRRASEMLRLYGEVDMLSLPQLELKKFRWLKEEGVISEEGLKEVELKIAALSKTPLRFA